MADAALFLTDLALGLLLGCVFAVVAHGLNLIWGVAKVVNVAHGEFIMLAAYGAYFLNVSFGFNPLLSVPVDAAIGLAAGVGFYFGFLHRELRGKEAMGPQSEMVTLVATFGLSLVLINTAQTLWTTTVVGIRWSPGALVDGPFQLVLGGPGKMWGSLVGGLILGVIINVGQLFVGSLSVAYAIAFLVLIPVLLLRPEGILR